MTPKKLSDSDKLEIISLYRQTDENTITLAKRYGVSSSTVRRMLQSSLSSEEYETLVQQKQKRSFQTPPPTTKTTVVEELEEIEEVKELEEVNKIKKIEEEESPSVSQREELNSSDSILGVRLTRTRRRSSSTRESLNSASPSNSVNSLESDFTSRELPAPTDMNLEEEDYESSNSDLAEITGAKIILEGEDFEDFDSEMEEDEDQDQDEDEDEDEEQDQDEDDYEPRDYEEDDSFFGFDLASTGFQLRGNTLVILPLHEASLPRTCYLVVDRSAELITRPLKAFGELGQIPPEEIWEKTLPIFDNHRVARRFCARNQRVCKVPDSRVLQKVTPYLQAKGITRLLIDGQVYSL